MGPNCRDAEGVEFTSAEVAEGVGAGGVSPSRSSYGVSGNAVISRNWFRGKAQAALEFHCILEGMLNLK